jgi:hypothetical protein
MTTGYVPEPRWWVIFVIAVCIALGAIALYLAKYPAPCSLMLGLGGFERTQRYDVIRRKSAPFAGRSLPTVTRWTTRQALARLLEVHLHCLL